MNSSSQSRVTGPSAKQPPLSPAQPGLLQRKCGCSPSMSGDCEQCKNKQPRLSRYSADRPSPSLLLSSLPSSAQLEARSAPASDAAPGHSFGRVSVHSGARQAVQTKLAVSQPGDQLEQEADRAAEIITGSSHSLVAAGRESKSLSSGDGLIQRSPAEESGTSPAMAPSSASPETTPSSASPEVAPPAEAPLTEQAAPVLLVAEDDVQELSQGQMRKSEFLDEMERAICAAADAELAAVGRSAQGCPYIERWMNYYRSRSSLHVERALRRYAPEAAGVTDARGYIPFVAERVRRAVTVWATTGEISGVPDELASQFSGGGVLGAVSGMLGGVGTALAGIFTKAKDGGARKADDPQAVQSQLGSGRSLESGVRTRMESAFGYDFSRVRVHNDSHAAQLSNNLNARAFTIGSNVAFAAGEYQPGSLVGDALLAHELAHVVQQGGGSTSVAPMRLGEDNSALENDADSSAVRVVTSLWSGANKGAKESSQSAIPRLRSGLGLSRCTTQTRPPAAPTNRPAGSQSTAPTTEPNGQPAAQPAAASTPQQAEEEPDTLVLPEFDCSPTGVTLPELTAIPGTSTTNLGWTKPNTFTRSFAPLFHTTQKNCRIGNIKEAKFSLEHFVYVKPGTYRYGTQTRQHSSCGNKDLPLHIEVTTAMAEKLKQGEIEHCQDLKRAFAFTFMRFNKAAREIQAEAPTPAQNQAACTNDIKARLAAKMGTGTYDGFGPIRDCLFGKTKDRDTQGWHDVNINITSAKNPDAGCNKITHVLDPANAGMMPELGKHSTRKLVKGCGE
jgi:hypothetical protein